MKQSTHVPFVLRGLLEVAVAKSLSRCRSSSRAEAKRRKFLFIVTLDGGWVINAPMNSLGFTRKDRALFVGVVADGTPSDRDVLFRRRIHRSGI